MQFLLDTNVISELVKPAPHPGVAQWVRAQRPLDLAISALTLGEIEHGIALLPEGRRRKTLTEWARAEIPRAFAGRVLPVDADVAVQWGALLAHARLAGRPMAAVDALIVATAQVHELTLVTRNTVGCASRGVPVHDPWTDRACPSATPTTSPASAPARTLAAAPPSSAAR